MIRTESSRQRADANLLEEFWVGIELLEFAPHLTGWDGESERDTSRSRAQDYCMVCGMSHLGSVMWSRKRRFQRDELLLLQLAAAAVTGPKSAVLFTFQQPDDRPFLSLSRHPDSFR